MGSKAFIILTLLSVLVMFIQGSEHEKPTMDRLITLIKEDLLRNTLSQPFLQEKLDLIVSDPTFRNKYSKSLQKVKEIRCSNCDISRLGDVIGIFIKLKTLDLSGNRITELPPNLSNLIYLENLDLSRNNLETVPEFGRLENLKVLNLDHNKIKSLPDSIGGLLKLETMSLARNELKRLPESFKGLLNLKKLNLQGNLIAELRDDFWTLPGLVNVDLSHNKIKFPVPALPFKESVAHAAALAGEDLWPGGYTIYGPVLKEIKLAHNSLETLPQYFGTFRRLESLDLSMNRLKYFPDEILNLEVLKSLDIRNNPFILVTDPFLGPDSAAGYNPWAALDPIFMHNMPANHPRIYLKELKDKFGHRLVMSRTQEEYYAELYSQKSALNRDYLKSLIPKRPSAFSLDGQKALELWQKVGKPPIQHQFQHQEQQNFLDSIDIIKSLYGITSDGWNSDELKRITRDYFEGCLMILMRFSKEQLELARYFITYALIKASHGQVSKLQNMYLMLVRDEISANEHANPIDLVKELVAIEKSLVFNSCFEVDSSKQMNEIDLQYWSMRLDGDLGLNYKYEPTFTEPPPQDHQTDEYALDVLKSFYSRFTPEHVINHVMFKFNAQQSLKIKQAMKDLFKAQKLLEPKLFQSKKPLFNELAITKRGTKVLLSKAIPLLSLSTKKFWAQVVPVVLISAMIFFMIIAYFIL